MITQGQVRRLVCQTSRPPLVFVMFNLKIVIMSIYTYPDDITIEFSDVCSGSRVLQYSYAAIPDGVTVFSPDKIRKSRLYFHCYGYVLLSALVDTLGSSQRILYSRHQYVVNEFSAAVWSLRNIGQSSRSSYSRVKYDGQMKRYHIACFFKLDIKK